MPTSVISRQTAHTLHGAIAADQEMPPCQIPQAAAVLVRVIRFLAEQQPGPEDSLFIITNFQAIAAFGRARVAFHNAMKARPNVHTDMFVAQSGDIKAAGEHLITAVQALSIEAFNALLGLYRADLQTKRTNYRRALEEFSTALGYPVYDPGALSYNRSQSESALYFD